MSNAATRAATPITTLVNSTIAELVRGLGQLFRLTLPVSRETVLHWVLLGVVLGIGTFVRFWNLGRPGLHGDEETMAMAAMHIVQNGWPILPSGMFYPRGLSELYLMAASVQLFGESEWSFRLPSALAGVAMIFLCYLAGRRFLRPHWNLALAATVALLPDMIEYSQTARMYIFMLAAIAGSLVCLFAWERNGRIGWLIGAVLALILGIELHALAVTCALLFLMPGLLQGNQRKFMYGLVAVAVTMLAYLAIDTWVNSNYPVPPPEYIAQAEQFKPGGAVLRHHPFVFDIAIWIAGAVTAFLAVLLGQRVRPRWPAFWVTVLMLACSIAQLAVYYHIAALLGLAGSVVAFRYRGTAPIGRRYMRFVLGCAAIALVHVGLITAWPGSMIKLVGAIVGQPSVWPYARILQFSVAAGVLAVAATAWGLWNLANRKRVTDYWLLAMLGVWIPVFCLGFFMWDIPARYTAASLVPLLLCAFAFAQRGVDRVVERARLGAASRPLQGAAVLGIAVAAANPTATFTSMMSDGSEFPDHRGAAQFVRTLHITPDDIVLAEDVLQQTYYLGHVDYWLIGRKHSWRYLQQVDGGRIQDFYTATAVIDNGEQFEALLDANPQRRIFVIGSGENTRDGRREMRGEGIDDLLHSDRFESLFLGSDHFTRVWQAKPPGKQQPLAAQ